MGGYPVSLSSIGAIQQICGTFAWSLVGKHQKPVFSTFFGPKLIFFPIKVVIFFCWSTFYNQICGYPVSLSSIGAVQQICETITWILVGKHQKTRFSTFFDPKLNFFPLKWSILLLAHLLQSNGWLPCKFELNRSNTANLRNVFLESSRKTPKNPFFRRFLAQN